MNTIIRAPFSEEERANIRRYQTDRKLSDRLTCPRMVNGKLCKENYVIPGMHTFFPLYRNTVLVLGDNDWLYCPQCKVDIQDFVDFTKARYTADIQSEVHREISKRIDLECKEMSDRSRDKREATFTRLRFELADAGIPYTEVPSPPNSYYHYEFRFEDYPLIRLNIGYDGAIGILYSNTDWKDHRSVQWIFSDTWKESIGSYLGYWAVVSAERPSYWDVPLK
jgi:hypothetical protein